MVIRKEIESTVEAYDNMHPSDLILMMLDRDSDKEKVSLPLCTDEKCSEIVEGNIARIQRCVDWIEKLNVVEKERKNTFIRSSI